MAYVQIKNYLTEAKAKDDAPIRHPCPEIKPLKYAVKYFDFCTDAATVLLKCRQFLRYDGVY